MTNVITYWFHLHSEDQAPVMRRTVRQGTVVTESAGRPPSVAPRPSRNGVRPHVPGHASSIDQAEHVCACRPARPTCYTAAMFSGMRNSLRMFRTYPAPWRVRVWLVLRNVSIKIRRRSRCCGHPGQPGC